MERLQHIREEERASHINLYSNHGLFQEGSWLHKPVKTVMELLPAFAEYRQLNVLDLGCGVGRNCIPIAQRFRSIPCRIDCVDILELAVNKLRENAEAFHVSDKINGIVDALDSFPISENRYDLILAVSALEHMDAYDSFSCKLTQIRDGIRSNGIVCLIINTDVFEFDQQTGWQLPAQFEVNLSTEELRTLLRSVFGNWLILKERIQEQDYNIPRGTVFTNLHTSVFTFVAQKTEGR